jgi:hypothetical protein
MADTDYKFPDEIDQNNSTEDALEIEIEDDTPEQDRGRRPADPEQVKALEVEVDELDKYSKEAKDKMIQMKRIWNDERRAKEQAERERQAAMDAAQRLHEENKRIKKMLSEGEKEYKDAKKDSAKATIKAAKQAYKEAYESGDSERVAEAQAFLTKAQMELEKVKNFKLPPLQEEEFQVKIQQQPQVARPDDKVLSWQNRNPWFGQDEEMTASALGLHEKLKRQGVEIGSDEYYAKLDETMRKRFPEEFGNSEDKKAEMPKKSTVVAPANRTTAPKKVRLSTSQVAIAKKLGLTPEQYVRELLKMEA